MPDETAPIGLALTVDGDLEVTVSTNDSGLRLTSGLEAVTDNIRSIVRLFKGTWFVDLELGVPYLQDEDPDNILGERYDEAKVLAAFSEAVFEVPHVLRIQKLTSNFSTQTRTLTVYFEIITDFGVVADTVEI